jgi:hypothetical protein
MSQLSSGLSKSKLPKTVSDTPTVISGSKSQFATLKGQDDSTRSRSQSVILKRGSNVEYRPYAFTEQAALEPSFPPQYTVTL